MLFETYAPELADRAYATLLGEIGPKSILLLFLGLAGSMLIRFIMWIITISVRIPAVGKAVPSGKSVNRQRADLRARPALRGTWKRHGT